MTELWEYMSFRWTYAIAPQAGTVESERKWAYKEDIYIWHPGAEKAEHRPVRDSADSRISGPRPLDVLNELGAEGWELVETSVTGSAVGPKYGWDEASFPVERGWTLKRPVARDD